MKPLIVLLVSFVFALFILRYKKNTSPYTLAAQIAMAIMLLFTSIGHFAFAKGMALMLPDFIPMKILVIYATGVLEVLFAIGLLIPSIRPLVAWLIILFFIGIIPCNIKAALEQINYQTAAYDGPDWTYLWFRIPLQVFFIGWVYFSSIYNKNGSLTTRTELATSRTE
ncbi:DoxX family protein [Aureispira anguillae]|uniref:DoxX-like family protein n=1 Tax=Aureispira anguillae TaxID=2864201 RepID=A0A915YFI2_9BACT|nr:hypothetical protein [Aureispira anguillae]BDS12178.1 hypothetical protein AsAng_0028930 [Aureispira anguillae]